MVPIKTKEKIKMELWKPFSKNKNKNPIRSRNREI